MPNRPDAEQLTVISTPTPFPVGDVNVFLWRGEQLTLVDTGTNTDEAWEALVRGLRQAGVAVTDLERVFLTHHHVDHVGGLGRIQDTTDVEVYGHPDIAEHVRLSYSHDEAHHDYGRRLLMSLGMPERYAEEGLQLWGRFRQFSMAYKVDRHFDDGVPVGPFTPYFVPGHSATDTLLSNHGAGFSITGDHILESINPNPLLRRATGGKPRPRSLVEYQTSLKRSRELPLGRCYPSHGAPFDDHVPVVDGVLAQQARREKRVLERLPRQGCTPYELSHMLYPRQTLENFYLCLSVATGHLELLEEKGLARSGACEGALVYYKVEEAHV